MEKWLNVAGSTLYRHLNARRGAMMVVAVRKWRGAVRSPWFWCGAVVLVIVVGSGLSALLWDELHHDGHGATVRNMSLVIGGIAAGVMASWRLVVGHRQAETQAEEAKVANLGLVHDRFRTGTEMLRSDDLPVRLAGIHVLKQLAAEHPDEIHAAIMAIFCAFVQMPIGKISWRTKVDGKYSLVEWPDILARGDVQAIMKAIGGRSDKQIQLEAKKHVVLNLMHANLRSCMLIKSNLNGVYLCFADLTDATFTEAKLSQADFTGANLTEVKMTEVDLSGCVVERADVSGAKFVKIKGLTQRDLDKTHAKENRPPTLKDALDADTGKPLVWRGGLSEHQDSPD